MIKRFRRRKRKNWIEFFFEQTTSVKKLWQNIFLKPSLVRLSFNDDNNSNNLYYNWNNNTNNISYINTDQMKSFMK